MKIGLLVHNINNLGGIITYVERLAKGLLEAGHECEILQLCYQEKVTESRNRAKGYVQGETDILVHPIYGWAFPAKNRIAYKNNAINIALDRLSKYDLLIWETPAPSMPINKQERNNLEWLKLFRNGTKQIITIHDGNLIGLYPHLIYGLAGVPQVTITAPHPRGFNSASNLGLNQTMIMIPQYPSDESAVYEEKRKGFMACQIFKAWKHVDEPVRAISYMKPLEHSACNLRIIAGVGLHYYYMTSVDKCKYYHPKSAPEHLAEKRIWDTAIENGMWYPGPLSFQNRDELLKQSLLFLDPSWVNDGLGNHLNGVVAEGIRMGCIPVGKPLTFRLSENDTEAIYQPNINYLEIPQKTTDKEYAECLEEFSGLSKVKWEEITQSNYEVFRKFFDYRVVAQQLLSQAFKGVENSGVSNFLIGNGIPTDRLVAASRKVMDTFTNASP